MSRIFSVTLISYGPSWKPRARHGRNEGCDRGPSRAINSAARVLPSHGRSQRFKSSIAHQTQGPVATRIATGFSSWTALGVLARSLCRLERGHELLEARLPGLHRAPGPPRLEEDEAVAAGCLHDRSEELRAGLRSPSPHTVHKGPVHLDRRDLEARGLPLGEDRLRPLLELTPPALDVRPRDLRTPGSPDISPSSGSAPAFGRRTVARRMGLAPGSSTQPCGTFAESPTVWSLAARPPEAGAAGAESDLGGGGAAGFAPAPVTGGCPAGNSAPWPVAGAAGCPEATSFMAG